MKRTSLTQTGFGHLAIILVIVVVAGVGLAGWYVMNSSNNKKDNATSQNNATQQSGNQKQSADSEEPDIQLQNLGWRQSPMALPSIPMPHATFPVEPKGLLQLWRQTFR